MENNEVLNNEEVIETTQEVLTESGDGSLIAAGVGLGLLASVVAYKYAIKPIVAKIKKHRQDKQDQTAFFDDGVVDGDAVEIHEVKSE